MNIDILARLSWKLFQHHYMVNLLFAITTIYYSLILYKLFMAKDGALRRYLLLLFSAYWLNAAVKIVFYNPYFNQWIQALAHLPAFIALTLFTWHIIRYYGIGGEQEQEE